MPTVEHLLLECPNQKPHPLMEGSDWTFKQQVFQCWHQVICMWQQGKCRNMVKYVQYMDYSGVLVGGMGMGYSAVAIPDILAEAARMTSNSSIPDILAEAALLASNSSMPDSLTEAAHLASNSSSPDSLTEAAHLNSSEESITSDPLIPHILASAEELSWFGKSHFI
jgi:hypothetical protein